ncbi:MAG: CoA transferase, partial [Chloroflexi bacterium]|nr:CoA transferase [Chloroflexota bacterium]
DPISGAPAAGAVLSALWRRRRTGKGGFIDVSQLESSISVIGEHILGFQMDETMPQNRGNRHPVFAPHGAYRCRGEDRWITIAVTSDAEWRRLCNVMEMPELVQNKKFYGLLARHRNQDDLDSLISNWTADKDAIELTHQLQDNAIAPAPVASGEYIFNDPHYQERGLLELVDHPSTGPYFLPGVAWKMSGTPGRVRGHSPRLGEHNTFIYGDLLGMKRVDIDRMDREGVTGTRPDGM